MVTGQPQRRAAAAEPPPGRSGYELVMPWLAGLTVLCSATALSGVIVGGGWLGYVLLTEVVLIGTGLVLRILRVPTVLVALGQLFALCCVVAGAFTDAAVAGFLPGAQSFQQVSTLLGLSVEVIRDGVPPVAPSAPVLCLATLGIGLVAIIVDVLVVPGQAPAAVGLLLLCVYAVPASLSDVLLPWWTFVLGAASFSLLLAVDRAYRHRPGTGEAGLLAGIGVPAAGIASVSLVIALLAGTGLIAVGTDGRLPGTGGNGAASGPAQLGIQPFTKLRGLLNNQQAKTELFRVRGLHDDPPYLRALTLRDYQPNKGWQASTSMSRGVPANERPLPGSSPHGATTSVQIESMNWRDFWLPVYGVPRQLDRIGTTWRYDDGTGIVYNQQKHNPHRYVEQAQIGEPTAKELRDAPAGARINQAYLRTGRVDQRVLALARRLTANAPTDFDKAQALYRYFVITGGFTYSLETARATDADALADFVLKGKKGFCEQYASAMAVMLRALGVPTRVAIGFTYGEQKDGYRSISNTDAHAWVEVYFPGYGWQTFDPTPRTDGRSHTPAYLRTGSDGGNLPEGAPGRPNTRTPNTGQGAPGQSSQSPAQQAQDTAPQGTATGSGPGVLVWLLLAALAVAVAATGTAVLSRRTRRVAGYVAALAWPITLVLAAAVLSWWLLTIGVLGLVALAPMALRARSLRGRGALAGGTGTAAVDAAWSELTAASTDRGVPVPAHETVRGAAELMIRGHGLDDEGRQALRELVTVAERTWYGGGTPQSPAGALTGVLAALQRSAPLGWRERLLPPSLALGQVYRRWLAGTHTPEPDEATSTDREPVGGRR